MSFGFRGLSDSEPISKLINTAVEGVIKVNDAVKGKPTAPPPVTQSPSANFTPYLVGAGAVVAGYFLLKKFGKGR
jgi:hypothetical protein